MFVIMAAIVVELYDDVNVYMYWFNKHYYYYYYYYNNRWSIKTFVRCC